MHRRPNFITHWAPYKYCTIYQQWNFAPKLWGKVPPPYSVMRIKTHWIHHLSLHINLCDGYIDLQRDSSILKLNLSTSVLQLLWVVPLEHKAVKDGNTYCAIVTKGFEALDRILGRSRKLLSSLPSVSQWFPEKPSLQWHTQLFSSYNDRQLPPFLHGKFSHGLWKEIYKSKSELWRGLKIHVSISCYADPLSAPTPPPMDLDASNLEIQ